MGLMDAVVGIWLPWVTVVERTPAYYPATGRAKKVE